MQIINVSKKYEDDKQEIFAIDNINIEDKGMVFIVGKSGSGKSTLLNIK